MFPDRSDGPVQILGVVEPEQLFCENTDQSVDVEDNAEVLAGVRGNRELVFLGGDNTWLQDNISTRVPDDNRAVDTDQEAAAEVVLDSRPVVHLEDVNLVLALCSEGVDAVAADAWTSSDRPVTQDAQRRRDTGGVHEVQGVLVEGSAVAAPLSCLARNLDVGAVQGPGCCACSVVALQHASQLEGDEVLTRCSIAEVPRVPELAVAQREGEASRRLQGLTKGVQQRWPAHGL